MQVVYGGLRVKQNKNYITNKLTVAYYDKVSSNSKTTKPDFIVFIKFKTNIFCN